ncbi:TIR domain-containing protein [Candidatus Electrothrix aarhusensis]
MPPVNSVEVMKIVFAEDVLQAPECWRYLDTILGSVEDGWHLWLIDDPDMLEESQWLQGTNRPFLRKLFEESTVHNAYSTAGGLHSKRWVVSFEPAADVLTPQAAACFFTQPLYVFVENRYSDGLFIETVLKYLAPKRLLNFLQDCQNRPWKCDSVGGTGQLPKLIRNHADEMADKNLPPHAVVFTDSDSRFPGHVSKKAKEIKEACDDYDVTCLILSKRSIENYIPDEILRAWAQETDNKPARSRIEVICRLTEEQRDHLAIKKTFRPQEFNLQEQALFATIHDDDIKIMRKKNTLGNDLIESLQTHKDHLSAKALCQRDGNGDLDKLVTMIEQAL